MPKRPPPVYGSKRGLGMWFSTASTASTTDVIHYTQMPRAKTQTVDRMRGYTRYKIQAEYTPHSHVGDTCQMLTEYIIALDDTKGAMHWQRRLTWERWCQLMGEGDDPLPALHALRSHAASGYRLIEKKTGVNILAFNSRDEALVIAKMFCEGLDPYEANKALDEILALLEVM